jgi:hypothetical protein
LSAKNQKKAVANATASWNETNSIRGFQFATLTSLAAIFVRVDAVLSCTADSIPRRYCSPQMAAAARTSANTVTIAALALIVHLVSGLPDYEMLNGTQWLQTIWNKPAYPAAAQARNIR